MSLLQELRLQHDIDLEVYRSAHGNEWNRLFHYVMIPLEVASFLWLVTTVLVGLSYCLSSSSNTTSKKANATERPEMSQLASVVNAASWTMGLLSCAVASNPILGLAVLVLHVFMGQACQMGVPSLGFRKSLAVGLTVWTISWCLQIGIGHYLLEGKPPNLFNSEDPVSFLSAATSIVLAWEC